MLELLFDDEQLATSLQAKHPGAAASMREGLEDTLTVQALGITGALSRTLRTTNPIENLNGAIAHFTRNVKRGKDGAMTLRGLTRSEPPSITQEERSSSRVQQ